MANLRICKRIAEIEGECIEAIHGDVLFISRTEDVFNPVEDKALCFDLMEKWVKEFGIDVHRAYTAHAYTYAVDTGFSVIFNDSLPKAICLARIAIYERRGR